MPSVQSRSRAFFRPTATGAFDQYLQDIQKLPLITDPAEERRLARLAQKGDEAAAERLVTANLRFVISYVKKFFPVEVSVQRVRIQGRDTVIGTMRDLTTQEKMKKDLTERATDAMMDMLLGKKRASDRRVWLERKGNLAGNLAALS